MSTPGSPGGLAVPGLGGVGLNSSPRAIPGTGGNQLPIGKTNSNASVIPGVGGVKSTTLGPPGIGLGDTQRKSPRLSNVGMNGESGGMNTLNLEGKNNESAGQKRRSRRERVSARNSAISQDFDLLMENTNLQRAPVACRFPKGISMTDYVAAKGNMKYLLDQQKSRKNNMRRSMRNPKNKLSIDPAGVSDPEGLNSNSAMDSSLGFGTTAGSSNFHTGKKKKDLASMSHEEKKMYTLEEGLRNKTLDPYAGPVKEEIPTVAGPGGNILTAPGPGMKINLKGPGQSGDPNVNAAANARISVGTEEFWKDVDKESNENLSDWSADFDSDSDSDLYSDEEPENIAVSNVKTGQATGNYHGPRKQRLYLYNALGHVEADNSNLILQIKGKKSSSKKGHIKRDVKNDKQVASQLVKNNPEGIQWFPFPKGFRRKVRKKTFKFVIFQVCKFDFMKFIINT